MDTPSSAESANESDNKNEESAYNENNAVSWRDDENIMSSFAINDEEEEDDDCEAEDEEDVEEEEEEYDSEKEEQDLLLALGEGSSEQRGDLPETSNNISASTISPSKFDLEFLQKSLDINTGLPDGLDVLDFNEQLSKMGRPVSSKSSKSNERTCLFLNNIYQTLLQENLAKVRQKLAENQEKQKVLMDKIAQTHKADLNRPRKNVFCIPYFHRKNNTPSPNAHTKILQTWHTDKIVRERPWTNKEHDSLVEAIHENVWEMTLKPFLQRLEIYSVKMMELEDEEEKELYEQKITDTQLEMEIVQQKDIDEILNDIDDDKIDWMKISNLTFDGKHSEFSCRLMWKNWLHPRLNKSPWSQKESKKLKELIDLHGCHQWKLVAEELGTNRTPFHCLQHYRRKLDVQLKREWTDEEDKILKEVLEMCRIGDHIPWNQVSFYMEGRSADACVKRWAILNPAIKRGRWTNEEDSLLLASINMIGTINWHRIRQLVPGRTSTQCRERWTNCLDPSLKCGAFTYDEDKVLLEHYEEHGPNWTLIASKLPGRTDANCRREYERLKKWEEQAKYAEKQSDESKSFFINDFDVKQYADIVEEKKQTLDDLFPLIPGEGIEITCKNQPQQLKRDLVRQEIDRRKGETFVPRPPILKKYSNGMMVKLWEDRNKLRTSIENFIEKRMIRSKDKTPRKGMKAFAMVSSGLSKLKPNTSVTEMLEIARSLSSGEHFDPQKDTSNENKRHQCADVDKRIRSLLYLDWLKEDLKDQPKIVYNKSKASCEEQTFLDRLEGMTLLMTALGLDRENIKKKVLSHHVNNVPLQSTSNMSSEELQNFRDEFLLISEDPQQTVNFSGKRRPKVGYSETIPPNIHTLTAFRLLFLDTRNLRQSSDKYFAQHLRKKVNTDENSKLLNLSDKVEKVKRSIWYQMLRVHFRSLFMWPALLSTLSLPQRSDAGRPYSSKKNKRSKYPMSSYIPRGHKRRKKKRRHPRTPIGATRDSKIAKKGQIPKPGAKSNSSEITTASVVTPPPPPVVDPMHRKRGRPVGAVTKKRKVWDAVPQRASSRQREKKARFDPDLPKSPEPETTIEQMSDEQTPSSSGHVQGPETTEVKAEASTKDLLENVSSDLVQQVISQEVQLKQLGTYINVPDLTKNIDLSLLD